MIPQKYNKVKAGKGSWFAATTDIWTSSGCGGEPYLSFTVKFASKEWKLESICLETVVFPDDHTAENITEMMENILEEWNIKQEQLVCVTSNNVSNMQKAFQDIAEMWLVCFGHNMNLAIPCLEDAVGAYHHTIQGFTKR